MKLWRPAAPIMRVNYGLKDTSGGIFSLVEHRMWISQQVKIHACFE